MSETIQPDDAKPYFPDDEIKNVREACAAIAACIVAWQAAPEAVRRVFISSMRAVIDSIPHAILAAAGKLGSTEDGPTPSSLRELLGGDGAAESDATWFSAAIA